VVFFIILDFRFWRSPPPNLKSEVKIFLCKKNLTQVKGGAGVYGERHCDVHVALIVTPASDIINNNLIFVVA
jgi:hypothetical protein